MATTIKGNIVNAPVWGGQVPVFLSTWSEIRKLGFKKRDRMFGSLQDGTQALFFMAQKHCCSLTDGQLAECSHKWYVTTETTEQIED